MDHCSLAHGKESPTEGAARQELQGAWVTVLKDGSNQQVTLRLTDNTYQITRVPDVASGAIAVHGDQIEFSRSSACAGTGTYRWTLNGNSLQFTPVSNPCAGRFEVVNGQTYTKSS